jgi:hypothetical protein
MAGETRGTYGMTFEVLQESLPAPEVGSVRYRNRHLDRGAGDAPPRWSPLVAYGGLSRPAHKPGSAI